MSYKVWRNERESLPVWESIIIWVAIFRFGITFKDLHAEIHHMRNYILWLIDMTDVNQPIIWYSVIIKFSILVDIILSAFSVTYCLR